MIEVIEVNGRLVYISWLPQNDAKIKHEMKIGRGGIIEVTCHHKNINYRKIKKQVRNVLRR